MRTNLFIKVFVVLLVLILALPVLASGTRTSGPYSYKLKGNGTLTITDFDWEKNSGDVYVPSMLDGYTVTAIGDEAFAHGKDFKGDGIIVILPSTITTLGDKAFYNSNVTSINIPLSIQSIGKGAFAYCEITRFSVEPGHNSYASLDGVLYHKKSKTLVAYPQNMGHLSRIPEGILVIDDYAFSGMKLGSSEFANTSGVLQLNEIMPATIIRIGNYAFADSTIYYISESDRTGNRAASEAVLLPESVVELGEYAFYNSTFRKAYYNSPNPKQVTIGKNLASIGAHAFENCNWYDGFTYELHLTDTNEMKMIGEHAFSNAIGLGDSTIIRRPCTGMRMASCCCTSAWSAAGTNGPGTRKRC